MEETSLAPISPTSFSLSNLNLAEGNPCVIVAETGATVTPYPFERIKFDSSRQTRFAILTNEVVIVKRHYHQELGYVLSDGVNDKFFEKPPSVVYLYPCVCYLDTNDKGRPLSDKTQVKMLICNKDMYRYLVSIKEIKGDLTQYDFLGSLIPGNDRFPKTQLVEAGPALWHNNDKLVTYIGEYLTQNADKFLLSVGKTYTLDKLEELLGSASNPPDTTEQDLDDIFRPM